MTDSQRRGGSAWKRMVLAGLAAALWLGAGAAGAAADPWDEDTRWISMRAGYAKSGARFAADGSYGYGFGYTWFLGRAVSWSASLQHDLLGRYGSAAEIEIPVTTEFARHFRWSESVRPYLGGGFGVIFRKTYRTGADEAGFRQGVFLATGGNAALDARSLIGFDLRLTLEQDTRSINPTFPNAEASTTVLSAKLSYSRVL